MMKTTTAAGRSSGSFIGTIKMLEKLSSDYIIFASEQRNCFVMDVLRQSDIKFKILLGSYKGNIETSYIIKAKELHKIVELLNEQESILSLGSLQKDGSRESNLVFFDCDDDTVSHLGMFKEIDQLEVLNMEAWSYDPIKEKFYGIVQ